MNRDDCEKFAGITKPAFKKESFDNLEVCLDNLHTFAAYLPGLRQKLLKEMNVSRSSKE